MRADADILREALGDLHKGETIERAVGRIVRREGGAYEEYLRIMDSVRDLAGRERLTQLQAAQKLAQR